MKALSTEGLGQGGCRQEPPTREASQQHRILNLQLYTAAYCRALFSLVTVHLKTCFRLLLNIKLWLPYSESNCKLLEVVFLFVF